MPVQQARYTGKTLDFASWASTSACCIHVSITQWDPFLNKCVRDGQGKCFQCGWWQIANFENKRQIQKKNSHFVLVWVFLPFPDLPTELLTPGLGTDRMVPLGNRQVSRAGPLRLASLWRSLPCPSIVWGYSVIAPAKSVNGLRTNSAGSWSSDFPASGIIRQTFLFFPRHVAHAIWFWKPRWMLTHFNLPGIFPKGDGSITWYTRRLFTLRLLSLLWLVICTRRHWGFLTPEVEEMEATGKWSF